MKQRVEKLVFGMQMINTDLRAYEIGLHSYASLGKFTEIL